MALSTERKENYLTTKHTEIIVSESCHWEGVAGYSKCSSLP